MTGVVIAGSLVGYGVYQDVLGIETADVDPDSWGDRPAQVDGLHNILLLGTDERAGDDAGYNELNGVRPDVLVIVSIDVDRGGVTMVNLPRDTMVEIPPCAPGDEGEGWNGGVDQINHAMTYGGMDCQGNTVETITGIHLDHMVLVDFAGFENIVDSVGGIEMCVPEPIDDPKAHLKLDAGLQELNGEKALGLARSRASTVSGSDLERIENQQRMIGAILREVKGIGAVFIGPNDLSTSLGYPGQMDHPETEKAVQQVLAACKEFDVPCGILVNKGNIEKRVREGFKYLVVAGTPGDMEEAVRIGRKAAAR